MGVGIELCEKNMKGITVFTFSIIFCQFNAKTFLVKTADGASMDKQRHLNKNRLIEDQDEPIYDSTEPSSYDIPLPGQNENLNVQVGNCGLSINNDYNEGCQLHIGNIVG